MCIQPFCRYTENLPQIHSPTIPYRWGVGNQFLTIQSYAVALNYNILVHYEYLHFAIFFPFFTGYAFSLFCPGAQIYLNETRPVSWDTLRSIMHKRGRIHIVLFIWPSSNGVKLSCKLSNSIKPFNGQMLSKKITEWMKKAKFSRTRSYDSVMLVFDIRYWLAHSSHLL